MTDNYYTVSATRITSIAKASTSIGLEGLLMDKVTHDMVVGQLKAASTPAEVTTALVSAMIAVVDCQMATGNRVKKQSLWIAGIVVVLAVALLFGTDAARQFVMFGRGN